MSARGKDYSMRRKWQQESLNWHIFLPASDLAFLEAFPELSRALRDFHHLCQEFEKTYVYIRGFAAYTLDKLRLIYEKAYRDCLGDSVKLQRMIMRGVQAEQDCFAELMEK